MGSWLRHYTKLYHYHWLAVAVGGIVATLVYASPGEEYLRLGRLELDLFYITLALFCLLFVVSVTDRYAPADYGLDRSNDE